MYVKSSSRRNNEKWKTYHHSLFLPFSSTYISLSTYHTSRYAKEFLKWRRHHCPQMTSGFGEESKRTTIVMQGRRFKKSQKRVKKIWNFGWDDFEIINVKTPLCPTWNIYFLEFLGIPYKVNSSLCCYCKWISIWQLVILVERRAFNFSDWFLKSLLIYWNCTNRSFLSCWYRILVVRPYEIMEVSRFPFLVLEMFCFVLVFK